MLVSVLVILLSYAQPKDSRTLDMFAKTSTSPQVVGIQENNPECFIKIKQGLLRLRLGPALPVWVHNSFEKRHTTLNSCHIRRELNNKNKFRLKSENQITKKVVILR